MINYYIMDRDGKIVIPKGTFDGYAFNNTTGGQRSIISDNDGYIVVSKDQISDWARAGIDAVSRILCGDAKTPLMQGVGGNLFAPQDYYTVEQSAITILRLSETMK